MTDRTYGTPDGTMLHFHLGRAHPDTVPDMARYAHARDSVVTDLHGERYVSLLLDYKASPNVTRRAQSFGWIPVEWQIGLPPAPIRVVTRRTSERAKRVGRPFTGLQTIIFDTQPDAQAIAEIVHVADPCPRRGVLTAPTSCGVWEVSFWRDRGWTRTEHAELWKEVHVLGGREAREGDFGCTATEEG